MFNLKERGVTSLKQDYLLEADIGESTTFHPENKGEIIYVESGHIILRCLDKARDVPLYKQEALMFLPRGRGLTLNAREPSRIRLIKLDPIVTQRIWNNLEVNSGTFSKLQFVSSDHFTEWLGDTLETGRLIESRLQSSSILQESIDQIYASKGQITIRELYESLGISKSTLEQHFSRMIGLSPKEYSKIQKLNYFMYCQQAYPDRSLTELAYYCGYYDQSHLIKDFRYYLDTSPGKFFGAARNTELRKSA